MQFNYSPKGVLSDFLAQRRPLCAFGIGDASTLLPEFLFYKKMFHKMICTTWNRIWQNASLGIVLCLLPITNIYCRIGLGRTIGPSS